MPNSWNPWLPAIAGTTNLTFTIGLGILSAPSLTAARTWTLRDRDGIISFTDEAAFTARISAPIWDPDHSRWLYAWVAQQIDPITGEYEAASPSAAGDTHTGPFCVELNNHLIQTPTYVKLWTRGQFNGQPLYDFERCCTHGVAYGSGSLVMQPMTISTSGGINVGTLRAAAMTIECAGVAAPDYVATGVLTKAAMTMTASGTVAGNVSALRKAAMTMTASGTVVMAGGLVAAPPSLIAKPMTVAAAGKTGVKTKSTATLTTRRMRLAGAGAVSRLTAPHYSTLRTHAMTCAGWGIVSPAYVAGPSTLRKAALTFGAWGQVGVQAAVTLSTRAASLYATGTVPPAAEAFLTTPPMTCAGAGTVIKYKGSGAPSLGAQTMAASGTVVQALGNGSPSLAAQTTTSRALFSEVGLFYGDAVLATPAQTCAGAGNATAFADPAPTLATPAMTCAGAGTVTQAIATGSLTTTAMTSAGSGTVAQFKGTGSPSLGAETCAGSGTVVQFKGTGTPSLTAQTCAGSGTVTQAVGTGTPSLGAETCAGSGTVVQYKGTGAPSLVAETMAGSGTFTAAGITVVQAPTAAHTTGTTTSTASPSWTSTTTSGNCLFASVTWEANFMAGTPAFTAPSGWTQSTQCVPNAGAGSAIYEIQNSSARSGSETFSVTSTGMHVNALQVQLYEVSGLTTKAKDKTNQNPVAGPSTAASTGTTATTTASAEFVVAALSATSSSAIGSSLTMGSLTSGYTAQYNSGSTNMGTDIGFTWYGVGVHAYKILAATGAQAFAGTASQNGNELTGCISTYK